MSEESHKQLVERLATDPAFGAWVRANPGALTHPSFGFDLTAAEAASLASLAAQDTAGAAPAAAAGQPRELETRRSKSGIAAGGAAAAIAAGGAGGYYLFSSRRGSTAGGRYSLTLAGQDLGQVWSMEGGDAVATVVNEKLGPDQLVHKHLGGVAYEDITLELGLDMGAAVYDWISQTWTNHSVRKDGQVVAADFNAKAVAVLNFKNALISEVGFPALDASSKDAAKMTLKLAPEYTSATPPKAQTPRSDLANLPRKAWLTSNFKIEIDGLDTGHVTRIEAFSVKQAFVPASPGAIRDYQKEPAHLEVPNLRVTFSSDPAGKWTNWHEDFVIKGNNGADKHKKGSLHFLGTDQHELGRLDLGGLGIFRLADAPARQGDAAARIVADLYCTTMDLHVGAPHADAPVQQSSPSPSTSPSASTSPSTSPSAPAASPSASHAAASPSPTVTASPSVSPSSTPVPSPSPTVSPKVSPTPTKGP